MEIRNLVKRTLATPEALDVIRELAAVAPHRTALATHVCEHFDLRDARGRTQGATCLSALRALEGEGQITLPASRGARRRACPRGLDDAVPAADPLPTSVVHVGDIELIEVNDDALRRIWTELLRREHPLGAPTLAGCQLRYLVRSAHGWIGALGFGAAALKLRAREQWMGWNDSTRRALLHRVVGMSRFLIRPDIRCENLASKVLGQALRALPQDFERRYGFRPWLVETFCDPLTHRGTCYRATNWQCIGGTAGRGRQDRTRDAVIRDKEIYIHALESDWRELLGAASARHALAPLEVHEGLDGEHWAAHEFAGAPLGDARLSKRLVSSADIAARSPTQAFCAVAVDDWAAVQGYYRLIDQPEEGEVNAANILAPHRERTVRRMQAQDVALCLQDGTDVNFTTHSQATGLGFIGTNQTGAQARGLHLHSTYAVNPDGLPLGVLRAQFDAPPAPDGHVVDKALDKRPKKTGRWLGGYRDCAELATRCPDTHIVSVMDREADMFELFDAQRRDPRADLLVRAKSDRRLVLGPDPAGTAAADSKEPPAKLFEHMRTATERGRALIAVGRSSYRPKASKQKLKAPRKERTADLCVHYEQITLRSTMKGIKALSLWCVHVREDSAPEGATPLEWCLLSTVPVESLDDALRMLQWYALRWRIEDWHRVLKSGCKIERLGHDSAERLTRAIAMRLVIAWRVHLFTLLGREVPDLPPELLFSDLELEVLTAWNDSLSRSRPAPTTLGAAVRLMAVAGGYPARNNDGPPGTQVLWTGMMMLAGMCRGYSLRPEYNSDVDTS